MAGGLLLQETREWMMYLFQLGFLANPYQDIWISAGILLWDSSQKESINYSTHNLDWKKKEGGKV